MESIGRDDQMPDYNTDRYSNQDNADYEEMVYGDTTSFYDKLKEQMDMHILSDKERRLWNTSSVRSMMTVCYAKT